MRYRRESNMINITGHTWLTGLREAQWHTAYHLLMHNEAFRYLGLDYVYLCFDVTGRPFPRQWKD